MPNKFLIEEFALFLEINLMKYFLLNKKNTEIINTYSDKE